ncbi:MAG: hypothetical protein ACRC2T_12255, partial [Thermoguttaceae bacterium]
FCWFFGPPDKHALPSPADSRWKLLTNGHIRRNCGKIPDSEKHFATNRKELQVTLKEKISEAPKQGIFKQKKL